MGAIITMKVISALPLVLAFCMALMPAVSDNLHRSIRNKLCTALMPEALMPLIKTAWHGMPLIALCNAPCFSPRDAFTENDPLFQRFNVVIVIYLVFWLHHGPA